MKRCGLIASGPSAAPTAVSSTRAAFETSRRREGVGFKGQICPLIRPSRLSPTLGECPPEVTLEVTTLLSHRERGINVGNGNVETTTRPRPHGSLKHPRCPAGVVGAGVIHACMTRACPQLRPTQGQEPHRNGVFRPSQGISWATHARGALGRQIPAFHKRKQRTKGFT